MNNFNYVNSIKDTQNRLISSSIVQTSNLQLVKNQEALANIINSYLDRFKSKEGMMTDIALYVVSSKDIITLEKFQQTFDSFYIDLTALYTELDLVDTVLSLNLHRNKNLYLNLKKKIRDFWDKLSITRQKIYDPNPATETFFESFYTDVDFVTLSNFELDKKEGFLQLASDYKTIHNRKHEIKKVTSITYPVANDEGGVKFYSDILNSLDDNYLNGPRDMLENGLWKEELVCSDIPEITLNIANSGTYRSYTGIVSVVDIEYCSPVKINRLDIDLFGEFSTLVDSVMYKQNESDDWQSLNLIKNDPGTTLTDIEESTLSPVRGSNFDIISFQNIEQTQVKFIRLVFNQKHYVFLNTLPSSDLNSDTQLRSDLSERRYDLFKFGSNLANFNVPTNDYNRSLYAQIIGVIESTRDIQSILNKILNILIPQVSIETYNFSKSVQFQIGTWSIEPKEEKYTSAVAQLESTPYGITDKSLSAISLSVDQIAPKSCTSNWYIGIGGQNIPIVEDTSSIRKEPLNFINPPKQEWQNCPGSFAQLDFPIDPDPTFSFFYLYEDGSFSTTFPNYVFLNSTLIYFYDIPQKNRKKYVIRYSPAYYDSVVLYSLKLKSSLGSTTTSLYDAQHQILCSRKELLQYYISNSTYRDPTIAITSPVQQLDSIFTVVPVIATKSEAQAYFGPQYNFMLTIDSGLIPNIILNGFTFIGVPSFLQTSSHTLYELSIDNIISLFGTETLSSYDPMIPFIQSRI